MRVFNLSLKAEQVLSILRYDPESGVLYWVSARGRRIKPGQPAGGLKPDGYIRIKINGSFFLAHRLAWLLMTGEWPSYSIDHINTMRSDNRWTNLRQATAQQQGYNQPKRKNNKVGFKGVFFAKSSGKYRAEIRRPGKKRHIGEFETPELAHQAYCQAANEYHKEFANHG